MRVSMENIMIFKSRSIVMQRLVDGVANGYTNYCNGTASVERCAKLVRKFDLNYHVLADRNERARRKRAGIGNAFLILWLTNEKIYWWLQVTPPEAGDHAAHASEKLRDAMKLGGRIEIDGFELVRLPKKAARKAMPTTANPLSSTEKPTTQTGAHKANNTSLTWRMNARKYQSWRDSIIESVRGASTRSLDVLIYKLWSSPGFAAIRSQIGNIAALYKNEVKRASRKDAPVLPKRLAYVRRLPNKGITLAQLVVQTRAQSAVAHSTFSAPADVQAKAFSCTAASAVQNL